MTRAHRQGAMGFAESDFSFGIGLPSHTVTVRTNPYTATNPLAQSGLLNASWHFPFFFVCPHERGTMADKRFSISESKQEISLGPSRQADPADIPRPSTLPLRVQLLITSHHFLPRSDLNSTVGLSPRSGGGRDCSSEALLRGQGLPVP